MQYYDYKGFKVDSFNFVDFNSDGFKDIFVEGECEITYKSKTYSKNEIMILIGDKKHSKKIDLPFNFFTIYVICSTKSKYYS